MALSPVFGETYQAYLDQIGGCDLESRKAILGYEIRDRQAVIPFLNTRYRVSPSGIVDRDGKKPNLSVCVILCKYLLMCPDALPVAGGLAAFKDFKDAGPLVQFFNNTVQGDVVRRFRGKTADLEQACLKLGGTPVEDDWSYQVKYRFTALPRVPVFLLFNDAEEGFAAQCTMLFEKRVEVFLDMESVAMLGGALSGLLRANLPGR